MLSEAKLPTVMGVPDGALEAEALLADPPVAALVDLEPPPLLLQAARTTVAATLTAITRPVLFMLSNVTPWPGLDLQ